MLRTLELFAGENASFSTVARALGHQTTTLDYNPKTGAHICEDILTWDYESYPVPDICWASPDCAQATHYRKSAGNLAKADAIYLRTIEILDHVGSKGAICILENPRRALGARPWVKDRLPKPDLVSYCSYSEPLPECTETRATKRDLGQHYGYRKPTYLWWWNRPEAWTPRFCRKGTQCEQNGNKHYIWARRCGSKEQILNAKSLNLPYCLSQAQLHRVPHKLCHSILEASIKQLTASGIEGLKQL